MAFKTNKIVLIISNKYNNPNNKDFKVMRTISIQDLT